MRHRKQTKIFGRERDQRKALMKHLAMSVVLYEKVETTESKAKAIRPIVERLITKGKAGNLTARRQLLTFFGQQEAPVNKLLEVISPRYKTRDGGYTRIIKLGYRKGDGAPTARIEFV